MRDRYHLPPFIGQQRDIYTEHLTLKHLFSTSDTPNIHHGRRTDTKVYQSQNVRSFTKKDQINWMRGWKRQVKHYKTLLWGLQEKHITSASAAQQASATWRSVWGVHNAHYDRPQSETSFWIVSTEKSGGDFLIA